ncbi:MAG: TolC family protein [Bacteroidota bacterium]|nr:TolC family protein [Bacteroidota bacterium]MDP4215359.1 TolC family protein [Bacteroidota bacterium]MDP4245423.1 TolC family protein [Bacteroidota bacterium]MDP4255993.1 TolC family protein [Bacteroidota bacterium]MDP4258788.1 TolC family protein [Bacteroidota bacterium]
MMSRGKLWIAGALLILSHAKGWSQQDSTKRTPPPGNDERTSAPGATAYSLKQCVDSALTNNPTVRQSQFTSEIARNSWNQQRANMLPFISGYASYTNNGGKSVNNYTNTYVTENFNSGYGQLQATLTVWNGGAVQNFIRQYGLLYEADRMDWQQAKDQMTVNVILAYLNVLSLEEQLGMAERQAQATSKRVELLAIQNQEGSISPSDLTDMRGQLASDELTVTSTQNALESNKLALAQFMNIPYSPKLEVEPLGTDLTPAVYPATVDQIYQNAVQNLAQVKAAQLHVASAQKGVNATRGAMMPNLSLFGQVYTNYSTAAASQRFLNTTYDSTGGYASSGVNQYPVYLPNNHFANEKISFGDQINNNVNTQVGIQLSIPILNGLRARTQYKQARVNLEQAKFNANTTITVLRQSIESYYVTMMAAFRTYSTLSEQVKNYQESFRAAEIKYDAGAMKSLDFIIYKTNIDRASLNLIQAKYNYVLQTKVLDYFQGVLTW